MAGDMSVSDRAAARTRLRETILANRSYGPPSRRWYNTYATTSWTASEAADAVANMPPHALFAPQYRVAEDDYLYGRVFALAGHADLAKIAFSRAVHSCAIHKDIYRMEAHVALADLLDDHDPEKCSLYARVAEHWKRSPTAKTVSLAIAERHRLNCL